MGRLIISGKSAEPTAWLVGCPRAVSLTPWHKAQPEIWPTQTAIRAECSSRRRVGTATTSPTCRWPPGLHGAVTAGGTGEWPRPRARNGAPSVAPLPPEETVAAPGSGAPSSAQGRTAPVRGATTRPTAGWGTTLSASTDHHLKAVRPANRQGPLCRGISLTNLPGLLDGCDDPGRQLPQWTKVNFTTCRRAARLVHETGEAQQCKVHGPTTPCLPTCPRNLQCRSEPRDC